MFFGREHELERTDSQQRQYRDRRAGVYREDLAASKSLPADRSGGWVNFFHSFGSQAPQNIDLSARALAMTIRSGSEAYRMDCARLPGFLRETRRIIGAQIALFLDELDGVLQTDRILGSPLLSALRTASERGMVQLIFAGRTVLNALLEDPSHRYADGLSRCVWGD